MEMIMRNVKHVELNTKSIFKFILLLRTGVYPYEHMDD